MRHQPIVTLTLLLLGTAATGTQKPPTLREEFVAIMRKSDDCWNRKDLDGILRRYAPDFTGEGVDGTRFTKNEAAENGRRTLSSAETVTARTRLIDVKRAGKEVVTLTREHTELRLRGKKTGQPHTLLFEATWRGTWVQRQGVWLQRRLKQLSLTITRDGVAEVVRPESNRAAPK